MHKKLFVGFKGKNNASYILVNAMSADRCLLTNSFDGLKRDIEALSDSYDYIVIFGIDKTLKDTVRIEVAAEKDGREVSVLDLDKIAVRFNAEGIPNFFCSTPTQYLCNAAYWHLLRKYNGKAVLIHIPSIRNLNPQFIERLKSALE